MHTSKIIIGAMAATLLLACNPKKEETKTTEAQEVSTETVATSSTPVIVEQSRIDWVGRKVGGAHNGTIALKSGAVSYDLTTMELHGGDFVIDMHSINNLDVEGDGKAQLEAHLKSPDFFDVEKYPEASFRITSARKLSDPDRYMIVGNLTIKETTNSIEFAATITHDQAKNQLIADSDEINIDRTKWGVNYGSKNIFKDLKDKAIDDHMSIKLHIVAQL